MPGVTLHFVLADQIIDYWRSSRGDRPFDVDDPTLLNAFFHGAIGPDLGYFPGGDRFLSELSHCVRTGVLTRTLVASARTPIERAFAWGWLTHVIADREIHPLIGRAVGEHVRGSRRAFVDGASDPLHHLRVELGLDCWYAARHPRARTIRLTPVFDHDSIAYLREAYQSTYGVAIPDDTFLRSHQITGRRAGQSLATLWIIGALMRDRAWKVTIPGMRWMLCAGHHFALLRGISLAYLTPIDPAKWLLRSVAVAVARHRSLFLESYRGGVEELADVNLDTGRLITCEPKHAGTLAARRTLAAITRSNRRSQPERDREGTGRSGAPVRPFVVAEYVGASPGSAALGPDRAASRPMDA